MSTPILVVAAFSGYFMATGARCAVGGRACWAGARRGQEPTTKIPQPVTRPGTGAWHGQFICRALHSPQEPARGARARIDERCGETGATSDDEQRRVNATTSNLPGRNPAYRYSGSVLVENRKSEILHLPGYFMFPSTLVVTCRAPQK